MWYVHVLEHHSLIEWNEALIHATCNVDEPQQHHAKQERPTTKDQIVHNSLYMECPEQADPLMLNVD